MTGDTPLRSDAAGSIRMDLGTVCDIHKPCAMGYAQTMARIAGATVMAAVAFLLGVGMCEKYVRILR